MSKIIDDIKSDPKGALLVFGILILIIAYVLFSGHREAVQKEEARQQAIVESERENRLIEQLSVPGTMLYEYILGSETVSAAEVAYMADIIYSDYAAGVYD